nr:hypothetical protein [Tanacetum cinerariifolium]
MDIAMREFKECIDIIKFMDIPSLGMHYTWNHKPKGFDGLLKKIDRVLGNMQFCDMFVGTHAIFKPYRSSDYAPAVLFIPTVTKCPPKPFKFANIVTQYRRFNEERFLKQKVKVQWLKEGDANSAYFHKAVKGRMSKSRIDVVMDVPGTIFVNDRVADAFVSHYEKWRVKEADGFKYHRFCLEMELINLCFVDDLFLFTHADVNSAKIIMESLDEFKHVYGLTSSLPKSTAYFCNVLNHTKLAILQVMPFEEGRLPIKYLGVPLVPFKLVYKDCKELIVKVHARTNDWKNKSLSITGRLQLVQSVISSINVYWASAFILPTRILLDIEQIMRGFLWCQGSMKKGKSKVAWEKLLSKKESLWVTWIHMHKIKDRNFWDLPCHGKMSWAWRKVLQLRSIIRKFVWHKIGDGNHTSIWFDQWCHLSPLADFISHRDMYRAGLSSSSKVADLFATGSFVWPPDLLCLHSIRPRDVKVDWVDVVWFPNCIPRHAFNLWLVIKKKLKMQDRLLEWDVNGSLARSYTLCESQPDSHEHLFFECSFSRQVWCHMRNLVGLSLMQPSLEMILSFIIPMAKRRTSKCVITKLVIAASVYFIWQERNGRLFNNNKRTTDQVIECIMSSIRLKLMSCRFKKSKVGGDVLKRWNLLESLCS